MQVQNYQKINSRIAGLSVFALLILVALIASKLVQQFLQEEAPIKPFVNKIMNQPINSPVLNLPKNLFGVLNSPVKVHKRVKKTRLNLTLIGVLNQQGYSLAIIKQGNNNKEKIYKINDMINSSTTIKEIHSKYIILNRDGDDEKLSIKQKQINRKNMNL